ncbi:MAG: flagellar motor protein MotB [Planctomycetota bacterium]|jgi:chemotaxis protein MotB
MSAKKKQSDDGANRGPGEWIVTFTDCMTLLLCFFVMLLTFSTFEREEYVRLIGAFDVHAEESLFDEMEIRNSLIDPARTPIDAAEKGSHTPLERKQKRTDRPKDYEPVTDMDAYKTHRALYLRSDELFYGQGKRLTPAGTQRLKLIATFAELVPCRIIIRERRPRNDDSYGRGLGLARSVAVMECLTETGGGALTPDRFGISPRAMAAQDSAEDEPVIEVFLWNDGMIR